MYQYKYLTAENINKLVTESKIFGFGTTKDGVTTNWKAARDFKNTKTGEVHHQAISVFMRKGDRIFDIILEGGQIKIKYNPNGDFSKYEPLTDDLSKKLVDELFLRTMKEADVWETHAEIAGTDLDEAKLKQLLVLLGVPGAKISKIQDDIVQAASKPVGYFDKNYKKDFQDRGIFKPNKDLFKYVLLNRLENCGLVIELDWKADKVDVDHYINKLLKARKIKLKQGSESSDDKETSKTIKSHSKNISKDTDWVLVNMDYNSDTYNLLLLKKDQVKEANQLLKPFKVTLKVLS